MAAYYNENDPFCVEWLRNLIAAGHIADGDVDDRSIELVRPDDLRGYAQCHFFAGIAGWSLALRLAGWPDDREAWTGSCPCQSFSNAGQRQGFDDKRHLWPVWFDLIRECGPATIFGEQVEGAVRHGWVDLVQTDMEREGYAFGAAVLGAHSVGAPHIRQRLYFVAKRLADADHRNKLGNIPGGGKGVSTRDERGRWTLEADCCVPPHGMADSLGARLEGRDTGTLGHERQAIERSRGVGGMGYANNTECQARKIKCFGTETRSECASQPSTLGWMADADKLFTKLPAWTWPGTGKEESRRALDKHTRCGDAGRLADADSPTRQQDTRSPSGNEDKNGRTRRHGNETDCHYGPAGDGENLGLADFDGGRSPARSEASTTARHGKSTIANGSTGWPSTLDGFWRDADWLFCRDGKWRPVESGTKPLASRLPGRVGRLRAYGNAICSETAATFIRAASE